MVNNKPMLELLLAAAAFAATQNYIAERDPPAPEAGKQYRLWLRTPGRACNTWRKVSPQIPKEDFLLSEAKRDETGKEPGCKFTFVIKPATPPGAMKFELEGATGPKEFFEVPGAGGSAQAAAPAASSALSGIANENGTGMAATAAKGRLKMGAQPLGSDVDPNKGPPKNQKNLDTGTGL